MSPSPRPRSTAVALIVASLVLALTPVGPAAAGLAQVCDGAPERDFGDRGSISTVFVEVVDCMAAYDITVGFPDGTFRPGQAVSRQQMALFIARFVAQAQAGTTVVPPTTPDAFSDLGSGVPDAQRNAINLLAQLGITTGTGGGAYDPGGEVTRQQMATFITRTLAVLGAFDDTSINQVLAAFDGDPFVDLGEVSAPHRLGVQTLQALRIIEGRGQGRYDPGVPVTRQQMAQFLMRSAGLLDDQARWNGRFVVPPIGPPEEPDPQTPTDPTDPTDPTETPGVITNQSFTVTADAVQVPLGTRVTIRADLATPDVVEAPEALRVWLLDPDRVSEVEGIVTLAAEGASLAGDAVLDADDGIVIVEVAGSPLDAAAEVVVDGLDDLDDGVLELVVRADPDGPSSFVVLVAATDADLPALDVTGAPVADFGVSPAVAVQDVEGILLLDAEVLPELQPILDGSDGTGSVVRPVGEDVEVVARLLDLDDPLDADAATVALDGSVDYRITEVDDRAACSTEVAFADVGDDDLIDDGAGSAALIDGQAELTVPGGEEGDRYCLLTRWEGEGAYAGKDAESFAVDSHGAILFSNAEPVPTRASFVQPRVFAASGQTASVQVRVVDQFDNPVQGVTVTFARNEDEQTATDPVVTTGDTDAAGLATLSYAATANRRDLVAASVASTPALTVAEDATVTFYEAAAGPDGDAAGTDYLGVVEFAVDAGWVVLDTGVLGGQAPTAEGAFLRLDYDAEDTFRRSGVAAEFAEFQAEITAAAGIGRVLSVTNYDDGRADPQATVLDLGASSQFAFTLTAPATAQTAGDDVEVPVQLRDVLGQPVAEAALTVAVSGASGPAPGAVSTDAAGAATVGYASVVGDAGKTVTVRVSTAGRAGTHVREVEVSFRDGLIGAVASAADLEVGATLTLTFSAAPTLTSGSVLGVASATMGTPFDLTRGQNVEMTVGADSATVVITLIEGQDPRIGIIDDLIVGLTGFTIGGEAVVPPVDRPVGITGPPP